MVRFGICRATIAVVGDAQRHQGVRRRRATGLSRRVPPNTAMTSVANPPKAANVAICRSRFPARRLAVLAETVLDRQIDGVHRRPVEW